MKIELEEKDIMEYIDENHRNDIGFLFQLVDRSTSNYGSIKELVKKWIDQLKVANEFDPEELGL